MSDVLLIDDPAPKVRRLTLNRPEKRNALNDDLRGALFDALRDADRDREISVMIVRGAGSCFCAGYDLGSAATTASSAASPPSTAGGRATSSTTGSRCGTWRRRSSPRSTATASPAAPSWRPRATSSTSPRTPQIGYPPVRLMSPPDMQWQTWMMGLRQGMEALLTGDSMSGIEAADWGFANRAYPLDELEDAVLAIAERVAKIPLDLLALNKRSAHRAMEAMGIRAGMRAGGRHPGDGLPPAGVARVPRRRSPPRASRPRCSDRDRQFGDYRER